MKHYPLHNRTAVVELLYPQTKISAVSAEQLNHKYGIAGLLASPLSRNGLEGVKIHLNAGPRRSVSVEGVGTALILRLAGEVEGELMETLLQVPFTPFHSVSRSAPQRVEEATVCLIEHPRNPRLRVALGEDPNMKMFLYGAHPRQEGDSVRIKMPGAGYELLLTPAGSGIWLHMVKPGTTTDEGTPQRFTQAGALHRTVSAITQYHQQNQHRKERANG